MELALLEAAGCLEVMGREEAALLETAIPEVAAVAKAAPEGAWVGSRRMCLALTSSSS